MAEKQQELARIDSEGSGGRQPVVVHRRRRAELHAQQRPHADQPQAVRQRRREAQRACDRDPATPAAGDRQARRGRQRCTCSRCRTSRSRHACPGRSFSSASWRIRIRRSSRCWVPQPRRAPVADAARASSTSRATSRTRASRRSCRSIATRRARLGITPAAIDDALYNAFGQRLVSTIFTQSNQYRVVLEVKPEFGRGPVALDGIYVAATGVASTTGQGAQGQSAQKALNASSATTAAVGNTTNQVPLSSVATVVERPTSLVINHIGQFPAATLSFNLVAGHVARRGGEGGPPGADRPRHPGRDRPQLSGRGARVSARRSTTRCC